MARRQPGTGSVTPRRGRYLARIYDSTGKRVSLGDWATKEEADQALAAAQEELLGRGLANTGAITFAGFAESWLAERVGSRSHGTYRRWLGQIKATAEWYAEDLCKIGKKEILSWLLASKWGANTKNQRLGLVKQIFESAVDLEVLAVNPVARVKIKGKKKDIRKWLSVEEVEKVLSCEEIPVKTKLLIAFAIGSGLRRWEVAALEFGDLDGDMITVQHNGPNRELPKSGKIRRIPILSLAQLALTAWWDVRPDTGSALVWPNSVGKFDYNIERPTRAALHTAGVRHVRFHDFRHTCGVWLASGFFGHPWRLEEIRDFLGHATIRQTEWYARAFGDTMRQSAAASRWIPKAMDPGVGNLLKSKVELGDKFGTAPSKAKALIQPLQAQSFKNGSSVDPSKDLFADRQWLLVLLAQCEAAAATSDDSTCKEEV